MYTYAHAFTHANTKWSLLYLVFLSTDLKAQKYAISNSLLTKEAKVLEKSKRKASELLIECESEPDKAQFE